MADATNQPISFSPFRLFLFLHSPALHLLPSSISSLFLSFFLPISKASATHPRFSPFSPFPRLHSFQVLTFNTLKLTSFYVSHLMADIQPPDPQINGAPAPPVVSSETVGSKRQRRPSVRLGDIGGDQPYDSYARRTNKPWKFASDNRKDSSAASAKNSKTRPLTNLSSAGGGGAEFRETPEGEDKENNLDSVAIGSWRLKDSKRRGSAATKRVRTNWVSPKHDEGGGGGEADEKYSAGEDVEEGYRDYDVENSESPLKEQSSMHSLENLAMEGEGKEREMLYQGNRRCIRSRVSEGREHQDGVEFSGPSDTDARNWKCGTSGDRNGNGGRGLDGVRVWLNGLGLGRYAPVFEIHEVDDEVLPMLTLEDLKDMGITAVGSRRKMYSAIQKLGKGFS